MRFLYPLKYVFQIFRSVALLAADAKRRQEGREVTGNDEKIIAEAENFGGNLGMAFQLIDDYLDFAATAEEVSTNYL